MEDTLKPSALATAADISISYACEILKGTRTPSRVLAIRIFLKTGRKFGPVANLGDADIKALARIEAKAA